MNPGLKIIQYYRFEPTYNDDKFDYWLLQPFFSSQLRQQGCNHKLNIYIKIYNIFNYKILSLLLSLNYPIKDIDNQTECKHFN